MSDILVSQCQFSSPYVFYLHLHLSAQPPALRVQISVLLVSLGVYPFDCFLEKYGPRGTI